MCLTGTGVLLPWHSPWSGVPKQRPAVRHEPTLATDPRTVWVLGFVSMFMDISSEIIHALLPLFMTTTLGLSVALVGLVDGIAEATANISRIFSGYVCDRIGRRKTLILLGYGLGAASKPLFPLAAGALPIFAARVADRIGKGLRGAPRDALIADVTPVGRRGRAFGLRQSLDTVGAFAGPLITIGLMTLLANDMRLVFWIAVVPALIAVGLVLGGVEEGAAAAERARPPIRFSDLRRMGTAFWTVTALGIMFAMARISEAFLILKANAEGLPLALAPLVLVVMNLVYSLDAYPAGALSDRIKPGNLLLWGMLALAAADMLLAFNGPPDGVRGHRPRGRSHGAHGILARMIADSAPQSVRGSAFGIFSLSTGIALLMASVIAGVLWDMIGPNATFLAAAGFAAATVTALLLCNRGAAEGGLLQK